MKKEEEEATGNEKPRTVTFMAPETNIFLALTKWEKRVKFPT